MGNKLDIPKKTTKENQNETSDAKLETIDEILNRSEGALPRQVTAIVIGAGLRGTNYACFALDFPSRLKIVGVAEPKTNRRQKIQEEHDITSEHSVDDWSKLLSFEKFADFAIIATQDQFHKEPAIAFANKGYHLLLEKPMAVQESECEEIAAACLHNDVITAVGHVMRYFPPCVKIREIIDSGLLGEVVTITHHENILYWHFAHSFVRGNWRKTATSTFSLMAKCCHDIDLIAYWMGDRKCTSVHSIGNLLHFKDSQKPVGSSARCFDCSVEKDCPYSVQKIYLNKSNDRPRWPMSAVCDIEDHPGGYKAALEEALKTGPYGCCVYACDNDVCDHQVVTMEYDTGATVTMTMNAFTKHMCRDTKICGTHGELRWDGSANHAIKVFDFATNETTQIFPDKIAPPCGTRGHGGADFFLVNALVKAIANNDPSFVSSNIVESLHSHKLVFIAEKSRLNKTVEATMD